MMIVEISEGIVMLDMVGFLEKNLSDRSRGYEGFYAAGIQSQAF